LTTTLQALRHHQPQDYVNEETETLDEYEQQKCDAHPQRIDVKPFCESGAYAAKDPIAAAVEPLVVHVLHVRPFSGN